MAIIDDRTTNLNLPLPAAPNLLQDDVLRLRLALAMLDAAFPGKADLVGGKVPAAQLPSYVDDVLEFANLAAFPGTGETGKIYLAIDTGKFYRWSGSVYVVTSDYVLPIAGPLTLGGVMVGSGLGITAEGQLYVVGGGGGSGMPVYADQTLTISSGGQTVFTVAGGYNPGQIDVRRNGIWLEGNGDDYTASNGTSITLTATDVVTTDTIVVRKWIYLPSSMAVNKTGDTMTGALNWAASIDVASATPNIGMAASNRVRITGSTAITSLGTVAAGVCRTVTFAAALVLTHNATSLILPGGLNITTAAGDVAEFESLGSGNWRCTSYLPAAGVLALNGGKLTGALNEANIVTLASASTMNIGAAASNRIAVTGTASITAFDVIASGAVRTITFYGACTLVNNNTSLNLPTSANIVTAAGDVATFESMGSGNWRCTAYMRGNGKSLGNAPNVDGVVALANGGTSASTAYGARQAIDRGSYLRESNGAAMVSGRRYGIYTGGGAVGMTMPTLANSAAGDEIVVANIQNTWGTNAFTLSCPANVYINWAGISDTTFVFDINKISGFTLYCNWHDGVNAYWSIL